MATKMFKYPLQLTGGPQTVEMPAVARIKHLAEQDERPVIWAEVNTSAPMTTRSRTSTWRPATTSALSISGGPSGTSTKAPMGEPHREDARLCPSCDSPSPLVRLLIQRPCDHAWHSPAAPMGEPRSESARIAQRQFISWMWLPGWLVDPFRKCPHEHQRGIYADEIMAANYRRARCLDCGRLLPNLPPAERRRAAGGSDG